MIFVVLGTHELAFTRLLIEVEALIEENIIKDKVIVQAGHTKFRSDFMDIIPFVSYKQMDEWFNDAHYIISHAGTGSVLTALKKGKTVIAVPRLKKFKEHNDDHQLQLINVLGNEGHIIPCQDINDLKRAVQMAQSFQPKPFKSGKEKLCMILQNFIEQY
ncbi:PssE/Cps14G family polysaccharide biosynthesis glycosyltransferase [Amphibacillus cookii]|uniref:PssE/Cps14G family polysaccharide biosynthesis glycosyltransferase n=1 Tax=Amphibacillus cookii TaxID=767787 RepID=UPI00195B566B|nr:PssE/Cps14G family polysaccharide biosynthesis glycosyltransferase [Amphibacillus cookii]MBM7543073.1 UDP-N-acetylglucosamine transferase subunit ALG13 [Amphibacillus cookii]